MACKTCDGTRWAPVDDRASVVKPCPDCAKDYVPPEKRKAPPPTEEEVRESEQESWWS